MVVDDVGDCAVFVTSAEAERCRCVVGTVMKTSPSRSAVSICLEFFLLPHSEFVLPLVLSVLWMWTQPPSFRYWSPCLVHRFSVGVGGGLNADPLLASWILGALPALSCRPSPSGDRCCFCCCDADAVSARAGSATGAPVSHSAAASNLWSRMLLFLSSILLRSLQRQNKLKFQSTFQVCIVIHIFFLKFRSSFILVRVSVILTYEIVGYLYKTNWNQTVWFLVTRYNKQFQNHIPQPSQWNWVLHVRLICPICYTRIQIHA